MAGIQTRVARVAEALLAERKYVAGSTRRRPPPREEAEPPVVVRWSRTRKRHERKGILVEDDAIQAATQQCLGDAEARAHRRDRLPRRRHSSRYLTCA